jgi:hypothetical protein
VGEKLRVEVLARRERVWATNARQFDTRPEAALYARDLYSRWKLVEKLRIVPLSHPRREPYEPGSDDPALLEAPRPLFNLGHVVATPGAIEALQRRHVDARFLLLRHVTGDWGDLDDEDKARNDQAVRHGTRILSAYGPEGDPDTLWIITEAGRRPGLNPSRWPRVSCAGFQL